MRVLCIILLAFIAQEVHAAEEEIATGKEILGKMKPGSVFKDCPGCPEMVVIPGGSFEMGSRNDIKGRVTNKHHVSVDKAFALGRTEVTQGQWKAVMGENFSQFIGCGDSCPVENVSWSDAQKFIQQLNIRTGKQYRLPVEAEWEYACRAGGENTYCGSDSPDTVLWHEGNSNGTTHPVGQKQANAFGLYDMSGNVWEWMEDSHYNSNSDTSNKSSLWQSERGLRPIRGGGWNDKPFHSNAASRMMNKLTFRSRYIGFRLARTLP